MNSLLNLLNDKIIDEADMLVLGLNDPACIIDYSAKFLNKTSFNSFKISLFLKSLANWESS